MLHFLYELFDNSTNTPFYVGITENPNARFEAHISRKYNSAKASRVFARVQELLSQGIETKMRILEVVESRRLVQAREKFKIACYTEQGVELLNVIHNGKKKEKLPLPLLEIMHSDYSLADSIIIPLTEEEMIETEAAIEEADQVAEEKKQARRRDLDYLARALKEGGLGFSVYDPRVIERRKPVGWLQLCEVDDVWEVYSKDHKCAGLPFEEIMKEVDRFLETFSVPRLPVLREKDKENIQRWRSIKYDQFNPNYTYCPSGF